MTKFLRFCMRPVITFKLLLFIGCAVANLAAVAQWSSDPGINTPICTAAGEQNYPLMVSDGAGGAIMTWYDKRGGSDYDVYAQRVNAAGVAQWRKNGVAIRIAAGDQTINSIVSDGAGGAIIIWGDLPVDGIDNAFIGAQKVNAAGEVQWTANGIPVSSIINDFTSLAAVSDGAGGAIISWSNYTSGGDSLIIQHINATGVKQWGPNGILLRSGELLNAPMINMIPDDEGGAILTWNGDESIYAQRINANGFSEWTSGGVDISSGDGELSSSRSISTDGAGGVIITYAIGSPKENIYAQRVNAAGVVQWGNKGIAICNAPARELGPNILADGSGGSIITWDDRRGPDYDIYAQRINAQGILQWTANGVAICTEKGDQIVYSLVSDGAGGVVTTWLDSRKGVATFEIYTQCINAEGIPQWEANGVAIDTVLSSQPPEPDMVSNGAGGAIIAWADGRNSNSDVYAQNVNADGTLGCSTPAITTPLLQEQTVCQNTAATDLTVTATGTNLRYQWYADNDSLDFNGNAINGGTGTSFTPPTNIADTFYYYVIATNKCGNSDTSHYAKVIVRALPVITASPVDNGTITPSGATTFNCGGSQTYTIKPNACYLIGDVLVDGISNVGAVRSGSYTFNDIQANHTISVIFAVNQITISALPAVNGTITPSGVTIHGCGGSQTYTVTPDACYHIADILVDGISNAGAVGSGSYTFNNIQSNHSISATFIKATPIATISGGGTYCNGTATATNLTINATGNGTMTGTLSDGTPFSGNTSPVNVTVSPASTTTYTIATLSDATCTAQLTDLSGSATVTVNSRPIGFINGGATYCSGSSTATNLTINATGSGTINGNLSDGTPFNGMAPTITVEVKPTVTTTYTIANLSDATCTAQPSDLSGSATVTVNPAVIATVSGTTMVCQDASSPGITFSGSGGTAPYTFTYSINDAVQPTVSDNGSGTITISAPTTNAGTYVYKLISVQDNNASPCSQNITGQSATITINALSSATISGTTTVCQNSTQPVVTFNGSGGTAPYTFTYSLSDGTITAPGLTIKGNPATIVVSTANAGIYTYTLTSVQNASGCQQDLSPQSVQVTVNPLPNANISTTSMVTAASTGNTASVDNAGTGAVYNWTITNGTITNGAGTNSITYTAGLSGGVSLSVSVTGAGSCGPVSGGPVVVPITAAPCPNPAITASWIVCALSSSNIASVAKVTGNKYVWTITNGTITTGAGTNSISYKAGSFGLVILSVTVTNASGQCTVSSGKYFVLISPLPIAAIAAPTSVCASSTGNIAYVPGCGLGATYAWTISNGTITSGNNSSKITFTAGASGTVTLSVTATNFAGCKSSSGSKLVTIAPYPVASITSASSVCSGSSNNTASVASGGSGARYSWSITNGCITSGSSTSSITYTATKSGLVTLMVTVTNSSGCRTSSGNKVVTIVALPNAVITAASSVCAGLTGNTASVSSAGTSGAYTWTISGGAITSGSGTNAIKYTAGATGSVTLNVTVTNSSGCKATCSKRVTIITLPAATITTSSPVCGGFLGNIAFVSNAGTGATYAWNISNGTITAGGTTSSIKYTAGSSGIVALSITTTNSTGCKATGIRNITISAATVPSFVQIGPLCQKSTPPLLPVRSTNGISGTWNPSKISTSSVGTTTYTFTPAAGQCASSTTMKITVKSCTTLSNDYIVASDQAISKAVPEMDAVILPNPSENFFTLVIKGNRKEVAEVRILDVQGRWLDHFRLSTGSRIQFGGNYAHGTYIVQVLQGTDQKVLKAIKE